MSTQALSLSLAIWENMGGAQGACTLYKHRSMQPEPKSQNIGVLYLNLLNWCVDAIFVLPDLGTDQGMSTKLRDQEIYKNCA